MANHNMIASLSKRLNVDDAFTIKKCQEFLRILQSKNSFKLSEQVQTIICLDIATSITGNAFDKGTALQLCSLKKAAYENTLHNIKKVLNLDKPISIKELCVQFGCTQLKDEAEKLFACYKKKDNKIKDVEHPQYTAAAVYTVCKLNNTKLPKSQFCSISRLKAAQWSALVNEFEQFAKDMGFGSMKNRSKKKDLVEDILEEKEESPKQSKEEDEKPVIEDYEVWKNRILAIAEEAIRNGKD